MSIRQTPILATLLLFAGVAVAQDEPDTAPAEEATEPTEATAEDESAEPAPEPAPADEPPATAPSTVDQNSARRRRGTALGAGVERISDAFGNSLAAPMGVLDLRFGTQINDLVAVYVPLHLSIGAFPGLGTVAGLPAGLTGTLAATVVADVTLADRFFVGGGGGIGILNNPIGPAVHLRAGGYPIANRAEDSNRRKGMVVAADLRLIYAKGITATYPTIQVGFESF